MREHWTVRWQREANYRESSPTMNCCDSCANRSGMAKGCTRCAIHNNCKVKPHWVCDKYEEGV